MCVHDKYYLSACHPIPSYDKTFPFQPLFVKKTTTTFLLERTTVLFSAVFFFFYPPGNSRLSYNCCGILTRHQPLLPRAQCSSINFPSTAGDILTNVLQPQPVELRGPERCRVIYRDLRGMMAGGSGRRDRKATQAGGRAGVR